MSSASVDPTLRVQAEQVAFRYPQNGHGLDPTTLRIHPGQCVLVSGPSGSGKSTLARCLAGLIPHLYRGTLAGAVWVDRLRTTETALWQLAERAGTVFQNPAAQMLASTVEDEVAFGLENLGLPPAAIRERLDATLLRFGLDAMRARSPHSLSGGEQQKLALAATMARQPAVLVLDEPFSMLDATAVAELVDHLSDLGRSGTTIIICEHRPEYLQHIRGLRTVGLSCSTADMEADGNSGRSVPQCGLRTPPFRLEVSGLTVRLDGHAVLRDLRFAARGGEVIAIVGRNGVGKTTLLRALSGLQGHEGRVQADGRQPDLGMAFDNPDLQLFNASVRDEILYRLADPDMALYAQLLYALGLSRYEEVPPLLLSEGEKKRVALATVLMRRPRHGVLLDEPSLGQDTAHKVMLMRLARGLAAAGQLVMMTTHDWMLAARADRLLLLGEDGFVADGAPAAVMRDCAAWARIGLSVPAWVSIPPVEEGAR